MNIQPEAREIAARFVHSLNFCKPLMFASGHEAFPIYCGGTCFLARFRERVFVLTAKHCLRDNPEHIYVQSNSRKLVHVRRHIFPIADESDSMWADVSCLTTYANYLPDLDDVDFVDFDKLSKRHIFADIGQPVVVKSYPHNLTEVSPDNKVVRGASLHIGSYGGVTESKHCHRFDVVYPKITDPDGMSGSPVVMIDPQNQRGAIPTLLGLVIQGGTNVQFLRFIGVDVLLRVLQGALEAPF